MRTGATLDHVTITATDFARSAAFYDAALGALGMTRLRELVDEEEEAPELDAVAWGAADTAGPAVFETHGAIWLVRGSPPTTGLHIRLLANAQAEVETFYAAGVQAGGISQLAPRRWTPYRRGEFQAMVQDPVGNLIEACCPE